jgi:hypothetical protein
MNNGVYLINYFLAILWQKLWRYLRPAAKQKPPMPVDKTVTSGRLSCLVLFTLQRQARSTKFIWV